MTSADKTMIKTIVIIEIVVLFAWLIMQIFIPNMKLSKLVSNETAALACIKNINSATYSYKQLKGYFPETLLTLALEKPPFINTRLGQGQGPGYTFIYERTVAGYSLRAVPNVMDTTGRFIIFTDQSGMISACNNKSECNNLE